MTEDIKHIDENSQEYIAEGNRMTEVYTELLQENSELKTKVFRLEQERDGLKETIDTLKADKRQIYLTARKDIEELKQENEQLKKQNEILLGQLVINDGEDVTVQISQSQFDEYNELKQENELANMAEQANMRINNYRSALEKIWKIITSAWETGKYLDGGLYEELNKRLGEVLDDI